MPPAYSPSPVPSSKVANESTGALNAWCPPVPTADHADPFQLAMPEMGEPPAELMDPTATSSGEPKLRLVRPPTKPWIPAPRGAQTEPFHRAIDLAVTPPMLRNDPPAKSAGPTPSSKTLIV